MYYSAMKIMQILPELNEGGVERHVLSLSNGLSAHGHEVVVISAGGRLVSGLTPNVRHVELPVHRKNIFSGLACASRLASFARREKIALMHAHSRVPAWIALFARGLCGVPFVVTAHARYSLNFGLRPLKKSDGAICVSRSVRDHLAGWLPHTKPVQIIYNAGPEKIIPWEGGSGEGRKRLLYLGRLTPKKGIGVLIEALANAAPAPWGLDVVGDGPMRGELEDRVRSLGIEERIFFHGHSDDPAGWIARSDLFLFPSLDEGMGLSLAEALSSGVPVIASDLSAVRELTCPGENAPTPCDALLPPGDAGAWTDALNRFLGGEAPPSLSLAVQLPTPDELAELTEKFYKNLFA